MPSPGGAFALGAACAMPGSVPNRGRGKVDRGIQNPEAPITYDQAGEMMAAQPKAKPPNPNPPKGERRVSEKPDEVATLAEAGIDKNLAKRAPGPDSDRAAIRPAVGHSSGKSLSGARWASGSDLTKARMAAELSEVLSP